MKLMILCNMIPGIVRTALGEKDNGEGLWLDHVLSDLTAISDMGILVLCRGMENRSGKISDNIAYTIYEEASPKEYYSNLEICFRDCIVSFCPDVIHIWGTEYGHTLAMVNAAQTSGYLDKVVISIQGLISRIAEHYNDGLPHTVVNGYTFRDFLTGDNLSNQQKVFADRGNNELAALRKAKNVIGRTKWDEECTGDINPERRYFFCNETLRPVFYDGAWNYSDAVKHRIFAPGCSYPVKGFHFLIDALSKILLEYPDAEVFVPGNGYYPSGIKDALKLQSYQRYLIKLTQKYGLKNKIHFLGHLSADEMKKQMLMSNVFVLSSTIENSPNSLGEAMLMAVPCVAMNVGGVGTMLNPQEGIVISDPNQLADAILNVFSMRENAKEMGIRAKHHASATHNPETNLKTMLSIYQIIASSK